MNWADIMLSCNAMNKQILSTTQLLLSTFWCHPDSKNIFGNDTL